jgi:protein-S-isoprenylcysteine O-methyltransferase Ste14
VKPEVAKALVVLSILLMAAVRAPHVRRSVRVPVRASRRGMRDNFLVALVSLGFVLPLVWLATSALSFADYPLRVPALAAGCAAYAAGLWLLDRSHADLGTSWSNTLEIRQDHRLVTEGVYRRVRHPMYVALLLHGVGQALVLPNAIAGPSFLVAFAFLVAGRLGPEERMLEDSFGAEYRDYTARTRRLIPGIW